MSTTLITNGIVVDAGTMRPLDILISGERVESLLPRGSEVRADRVIDASGRYVLPGIIDDHVHFRDPGLT
ncbi:MAG: dihydroorotase, partial [Bilophila wadsworthia]